jgi:hypothetical protein
MFAAGVGVVTGLREGAFSVTDNTRDLTKSESSFFTNLALIFTGYPQIGWVIREVLINCDNYACALN